MRSADANDKTVSNISTLIQAFVQRLNCCYNRSEHSSFSLICSFFHLLRRSALCLQANLCPFFMQSCVIFVNLDFGRYLFSRTTFTNAYNLETAIAFFFSPSNLKLNRFYSHSNALFSNTVLMMHFNVLHYYEFTSPSLSS